MGNRLYRSRDDRVLAGVAGGVAEYFDLDPSLVRVGWAVLFFAGGFGLLLYIIMAIVVPEEPEWRADGQAPPSPTTSASFADGVASSAGGPPPGAATPDWRSQRAAERHARRAARRAGRDDGGRTAALVIGGLLVLLGIGFLAREFFPTITFDYVWPLVLVGIGVLILASAFRGDDRGAPPPPPPPPATAGSAEPDTGNPGAAS
jgi:phage shock protein C